MPELEYFLVARSISVDAERNSLSIFHVLNEISFRELPADISELALVSAWVFSQNERDRKHECQIRVEFHMPGEDVPYTFRGNLEANVRFQSFNLGFENVPVAHFGDLVVNIFLDDEHKAKHTIEIRQE